MLPLFMVLAWLLTTAMLCKSIVYEKERRLKEIMKIMGLGNGVHWVAWFINAFVMMFATILLLILLLKVSFHYSFLMTVIFMNAKMYMYFHLPDKFISLFLRLYSQFVSDLVGNPERRNICPLSSGWPSVAVL